MPACPEAPSVLSIEQRNALVRQYIPLVQHVVRKMWHRWPIIHRLGRADAVQAGMLALVRAAAHYDPSRGVAFVTYAHLSIHRNIRQAAQRETFLIAIPPHHWDPDYPEQAKKRRRQDVRAAVRCRCTSLERMDSPRQAAVSTSPLEALVQAERQQLVHAALARLPRQQREILRLSYLEGLSRPEVAARVGRSKERIRQVLFQARRRLERELLTLGWEGW
jgi:RNA polymerase sigma factor FliA